MSWVQMMAFLYEVIALQILNLIFLLICLVLRLNALIILNRASSVIPISMEIRVEAFRLPASPSRSEYVCCVLTP